MNRNSVLPALSVLLFILSIGLFLFPKQVLLSRLSPQGVIDPIGLVDKLNTDATVAIYDNEPVSIPRSLHAQLVQNSFETRVLGDSTAHKRIEVDLAKQRLYAFEGDRKVYDFLISSGKWGKTPTGTFEIWIKLRATKMEGGRRELNTYYYLPNVPYVMFFANEQVPKWLGFGIHGTYWHSNFGNPMSHGCINMKTEEAGILYQWAQPLLNGKSSIYASADNPGTQVVIYGVAPNS